MGIDIAQSRADKFDRCKYYKAKYVDKMKLVKNAVCEGVFYSTDKIGFQSQTVVNGPIKKTQITGVIETSDYISNLTVDDYVLYRGELYIVDGHAGTDKNESKEFSSRPSYVTEIRLRR